MAKQKDTCLTSLIEIPIVTSRTGPMKRLRADLDDVAHQLDQARNAMVRAWLRWREDHPDWKAPHVLDSKGNIKLMRNGQPIIQKTNLCPSAVDDSGNPCEDDNGIGFSTWLYRIGRKVMPNVAANLIAMIAREVVSNLQTDVQHHHTGHKYRWQAILANDESAPCFRARTIPIPNNSALFCYAGQITGKGAGRDLVAYWGKSSCVLSFPLFSGSSGRSVTCPIVTLNVGVLSPGNRALLSRVARGEWKFADSKLVNKNDQWQVQFTYQRPSENLGLDPKRTATLWPQFPNAQRPFFLESADAQKHWYCGNGSWLAAECERLDTRRKRIRERYRTAGSGMKGHGRNRFEKRLRTWTHKTKACQRHFTWQLIAEVVRFCRQHNCGSVVFREPSLSIRDSLWLAKKGAYFDWTGLVTDLTHKMKHYGINITTEKVNGKQIRERFGGDELRDKKPKDSGGQKVPAGKPLAGATATPVTNKARDDKRRKR